MNIHKTVAVLFLALTYSGMTAAVCGEDNKNCSFYQRGHLVSQSRCKITACADAAGGISQSWAWNNGNDTRISLQDGQILVNGRRGFSEGTNGQSCYGTNSNRSDVFCLN